MRRNRWAIKAHGFPDGASAADPGIGGSAYPAVPPPQSSHGRSQVFPETHSQGQFNPERSSALISRDQFQYVRVYFFPGISAQRDEIEGGYEAGIAFVVKKMDEMHVWGMVEGRGEAGYRQ
jgi:hypothetical protein